MRFKKLNKKSVLGILSALLVGGMIIVWAAHDAYALRVSLKRVTFEGSKRSEILTIINNSATPETYRLEWLKYRMEDGKSALRLLEEGETADDVNWADDMIRFAPRRVTVPAGGSQQVRLLLRRPKDLQEGEYRSHLRILTEVPPKPFDKSKDPNLPNIQLRVQPGVSLPVFVRHGKLEAQAEITNAKLSKIETGLNASFRLSRTGNRSVYGDFDFVCNDGGEEKILRQLRGIAVYTETSYRDLSFDLELSDTTVANCNSVEIIYRADPDDTQYGGKVLAQATATQ